VPTVQDDARREVVGKLRFAHPAKQIGGPEGPPIF
jgi:hypothetical protein